MLSRLTASPDLGLDRTSRYRPGNSPGQAYTTRSAARSAVPANGLELADDRPTLEIYRNDPQQTPEDELLTDVHVPIRD